MPEPVISVVIPTCDGGHRHLARCLDAVAAQRGAPVFETIVADSSRDATAGVLQGYPGVHHVRLPKPALGIEARGEGIRRARGRYVAFTDHDCVPEPSWLAQLHAALDGRPDYAAAGGSVTNASEGNPWGTADYLLSRAWIGPWMRATETFQLGTENALYRREMFEKVRYVGVTDEPISHGHLAREMKRLDLRAWFDPAIRVGHVNPETRVEFVNHQWFHGAVTSKHRLQERSDGSRAALLLDVLYERFDGIAISWRALLAADRAAEKLLREHVSPLAMGCCAAAGGAFEALDAAERAEVGGWAGRLRLRLPARQAALELLGRCARIPPADARAALSGGPFDPGRLGIPEAPVSSFALVIEALLAVAGGAKPGVRH